MASSKSLASTGSIVKVSIFLKSFLLAISCSEMVEDNDLAKAKVSSLNSKLKPASATIDFMAKSFSCSGVNTLTTSPSGLRLAFSHLVN